MNDGTETIRLVLDMGPSAATATDVAKKLDQVKTSAHGGAEGFRELETASIAVGTAGTHAMGAPGASGRGLMGASYAIQDFTSVLTGGGGITRALGAVTNNFDQLATAAGATAKQAAALSIGFTGFVALLPVVIPLFQKAWEALTGGPGGGEGITKALDAVDARLHSAKEKAEDIAKSFERIATASTKAETKGVKGLESVITEAPTEAITSGLTRAIAPTEFGAKLDERTRQKLANLEAARDAAIQQKDRDFAAGELDRLLLEAKKVIVAENRKRAAALLGEAVQPGGAGAGARERIADLATRFPDAFPQGFANAVQAASPEAVARQERFEKDLEARKQVQERIKRDTEERNRKLEQNAKDEARAPLEAARQKKERDDRADRLNLQGQQEEDRMREEQEKDKDDRVRESQQLARGVNRGLQQREQGFNRAPVGQHLPTIPQGATPQETMRVLIDSQARLEANSRMDREALRRAREINQKIRSAATAGLP